MFQSTSASSIILKAVSQFLTYSAVIQHIFATCSPTAKSKMNFTQPRKDYEKRRHCLKYTHLTFYKLFTEVVIIIIPMEFGEWWLIFKFCWVFCVSYTSQFPIDIRIINKIGKYLIIHIANSFGPETSKLFKVIPKIFYDWISMPYMRP